jgi:hypothetical protein
MRVWTIVDEKIKRFESCKEAAKWSIKNDNKEWYYDNGYGTKIGNKTKDIYCKYLSEITGLTVSIKFCKDKNKEIYNFKNDYRTIFHTFSYKNAKSFALGFVLGKNNKGN